MKPIYIPIKGKTYSFFGNSDSTNHYYNLIDKYIDTFFQIYSAEEIKSLLQNRKLIKNQIKDFFAKYSKDSRSNIHDQLGVFTSEVKQHIKDLSIWKSFDRTLRTKEKDYHFYMLEYEIINRMNKEYFKLCKYKIALLPHCLRDLNKSCKAQFDDIDLVCKGCSKDCFINFAFKVLKENNIVPYIWMNMNRKNLFKKLVSKYGSLGVLGIACLPELIHGMRSCIKNGIPVIGIPLNANRCIRWMGEYFNNSFCVERLEKLVN